jgi:hypothetical protein
MTVSKPSMPISTISIWHALQLATGEAGRLRDLTGIEAGQLGSLAAWQWLQICTLCHRSQRKKTRRKGSKGAPAICCQSVGTGTNSNYLTATAVFGCSGVCDVRCEVCQVAHCHACQAASICQKGGRSSAGCAGQGSDEAWWKRLWETRNIEKRYRHRKVCRDTRHLQARETDA